jgi:hypothetical protein
VTLGWPPPCFELGSTLKSVIVTVADAEAGSASNAATPKTRASPLPTAGRIPGSGGRLLSPVAVEARVGSTRLEQLLVRSLLGDAAVVEHDDAARVANRR